MKKPLVFLIDVFKVVSCPLLHESLFEYSEKIFPETKQKEI